MPDDLVQIDKERGAQHSVDLIFPRDIPTHQALQRARFVGCVVVDMKIGVLLPALNCKIDELLERAFFLLA